MNKIVFAVEEDVVIKEIPLSINRNFAYKQEVVIDKDTFIECYKRWILKEGEEE